MGGIEVGAAEGAEVVLGEGLLNLLALLVGEVGVLIELHLEPLDILEPIDELGAGVVAHEVVHLIGLRFEALRLHELAEVIDGLFEVVDDYGSLVNQPNLAGPVSLRPGEESDGGVDAVVLLAEVEDVAVGFGRVEDAVGAGESLDQAVVLEVLVDVERVEIHGVKASEEHVDDDGDVNLLLALVGQVTIGEPLVLDALLDVLVVEVEVVDVMVRAVLLVVVGDDGFERGFLALRVVLVVLLLLGEVLLDLLDVLVTLRWRREDGGDLQGNELGVVGLELGLELLEYLVVLDRVVDRGGGQQRVKASACGRGIVLFEDGLGDRLLRERLTRLEGGGVHWLVVIDVEAKDVLILDRVCDGVGVELFLEEVLGGSKGSDVSLNQLDGRVVLKDRCASEAEELGVREELLDGPVVLAELRAMALVEDEYHPLVSELLQPLLER